MTNRFEPSTWTPIEQLEGADVAFRCDQLPTLEVRLTEGALGWPLTYKGISLTGGWRYLHDGRALAGWYKSVRGAMSAATAWRRNHHPTSTSP